MSVLYKLLNHFIDLRIVFNGMLNHLRLFYSEKLGNIVHCSFVFSYIHIIVDALPIERTKDAGVMGLLMFSRNKANEPGINKSMGRLRDKRFRYNGSNHGQSTDPSSLAGMFAASVKKLMDAGITSFFHVQSALSQLH